MADNAEDRIWLDVAQQEREEVKAASNHRARWDSDAKSWWIDARSAEQYKAQIQKWLRPHLDVSSGEPMTTMTILAIPYDCWKCHDESMAVVEWQVQQAEVQATSGPSLRLAAAALATRPASELPDDLARFRRRYTKKRDEVYFTNGCSKCDAAFGDFPLGQAVFEAEADGIKPSVVARVEVPQRLVDWVLDGYGDEDDEDDDDD